MAGFCAQSPGIADMLLALSNALTASEKRFAEAVETLVDIAAMGRKAGSESAKHRLAQLGIEWSTGELKADYGSMKALRGGWFGGRFMVYTRDLKQWRGEPVTTVA